MKTPRTHRAAFQRVAIIVLLWFALGGTWGPRVALAQWSEGASSTLFPFIPAPTRQQRLRFNRDVRAATASIVKEDGTVRTGYVTDNQTFLSEVIEPLLLPRLSELRQRRPGEVINGLALFGHEVFRSFFGESSHSWEFYRWGGDLFDLDDPQEAGHRHDYRYGLDCSGFASLPYDLAVHFGLLQAGDEAAVFSSKGFERYCREQGVKDRGGRGGTSNRFRVDTIDMAQLGRAILSIEKGGAPQPGDVERLQPGDLVVGPGHVGLVVEVDQQLYYLESGADVLPDPGEWKVPLAEGLRQFAQKYPLTVRRSLPEGAKPR